MTKTREWWCQQWRELDDDADLVQFFKRHLPFDVTTALDGCMDGLQPGPLSGDGSNRIRRLAIHQNIEEAQRSV